jgi:hypothetical protein
MVVVRRSTQEVKRDQKGVQGLTGSRKVLPFPSVKRDNWAPGQQMLWNNV